MLPTINQLVHISLDDSNLFDYKARVADTSKGTFSIEMPIDEKTGSIKVIPLGTSIVVWYISKDFGQFSFETKVLDKKQEQVPLLIIENPKAFNRIQRRDFLRVTTSVEIAFQIIGASDEQWYTVKSIDISGGGLQFVMPLPLTISEKQEIRGWIVLPFKNGSIHHVNFQGEIVRIRIPNVKVNVGWISTKFTNIQENMRATVIRFCYEKQVASK